LPKASIDCGDPLSMPCTTKSTCSTSSSAERETMAATGPLGPFLRDSASHARAIRSIARVLQASRERREAREPPQQATPGPRPRATNSASGAVAERLLRGDRRAVPRPDSSGLTER
jgi:hypothetical protein